ncbi:alpha-xenorhabdolysin family binary toxin subunit B [Pseudomonas sp. 10B1]|uniref:alpha-xenorhabdolysin family binary toxin subunit B n=1 Tax=unclassified Pseudomonas TaxID=196821 RepID=UPI002B22EBAB|nr:MULTISPECIES: alpha-xenorhabdolysin family binary toxin subunit B [unclassified Pseudomonas]MEA9996989.1 alpha-xenorhabdolysin family binary toxin subunit B [Pseudomonas sp. AA4]MEB0089119.1 alpha-xenorhabdolysin family binary toxin subunit B [Pseudomonas sp. RTI1]MEB0127244.1 alpha-xenorhabdolysin family binary toxin subunit B [Pseudomonas sp. CCC1.2]MEB0155930.1 alpha-xenorhabdolysin family binary toxin subunit B [Pseudomonas sp. CCC4.3]MEB0220392.1 alpha-xenorhabdolysin family binary tox
MNSQSNVTSLKLNANYIEPNVNVMSSSLAEMQNNMAVAQVAFNKVSYLPNLISTFSTWVDAALTGRQILKESSQRMAVEFHLTVPKLRQLNDEYRQCDDPDEQVDILDEVNKSLTNTVDKTLEEAKKLNKCLANISGSFDPSATTSYLDGFETQSQSLKAEIEHLKAQESDWSQQRTVLTEAIAVIELQGVATGAQEAILTTEKIAELGVQPPEMALIQLAVDQLKKSIDNAKATFSFLDLVAERDRLRTRIDTCSSHIASRDAEIGRIVERIKLIKAIHIINEHRNIFATEFDKIVNSVYLFLELNNVPEQHDDVRSLTLINYAIQLEKYLNPIHG